VTEFNRQPESVFAPPDFSSGQRFSYAPPWVFSAHGGTSGQPNRLAATAGWKGGILVTATVISICASVVSGATLFFMQRFFRKREDVIAGV